MPWAGPECWGNRLQDWRVAGGRLECVVAGRNRTIHCLVARIRDPGPGFWTSVVVERAGLRRRSGRDCLGVRLGVTGPRAGYRSAAVHGNGLDAGLTSDGRLRIGDRLDDRRIGWDLPVRLVLGAEPRGAAFRLTLTALDPSARPLASVAADAIPAASLRGNVGLVCHVDADPEGAGTPAARFDDWQIEGRALDFDPARAFGPIYFAQYTLHDRCLKLTAQLAPVEAIPGHRVTLDVREGAEWRTVGESAIDPLSRTAHFRVEAWTGDVAVPYRVRVALPLVSGRRDFDYEGTIAAEPKAAREVTAACFSCNADHGFPDADVVEHVERRRPDLALFLGDQFYESQGGFGVETAPLERACLDVLRKWLMFGWSYREIFRHRPAAFIPDDHDMYHGNIWGEGGIHAPTDHGWGYAAQDAGGYKMPPAWVNAVQRMQTSHLPDPYDPTPVAQGIGVYYTSWDYAGVSFAILEDRKFKSAPGNVLPRDARVVNGFPTNPAFDPRAHRDPPGAHLLGPRQLAFLDEWGADWRDASFKVVVSQTPFCTVHTLPAGSTSDEAVPGFRVPAPGEYVHGDAPARDMDTNGWPAARRDEALRVLRKAFAFHIAGDQHLATVVQYGIEAFGDAGYAFTVPALNNIWPRRWWPPVGVGHRPLPGAPAYTGDFQDAFGNRITVHAAANPRQTGRQPAIIYDRVTGYGLVTFDKSARTIRLECWPRYADPPGAAGQQYDGWPLTIRQADNHAGGAFVLPELRIRGLADPVVQVVSEATGDVVYTVRIAGATFVGRVPDASNYAMRIGDGRRWLRVLSGIRATPAGEAGPARLLDLGE